MDSTIIDRSKEFAKKFAFGECWCCTIPISTLVTIVTALFFGWNSLYFGLAAVIILRTLLGIAQMEPPKPKPVVEPKPKHKPSLHRFQASPDFRRKGERAFT